MFWNGGDRMRVYDIIDRKKKGYTMTKEEIVYLIEGYVKGEIPDYQVAAWLMAVYYQGMTDEELLNLTLTMRDSGDQVDLSAIHGIKVDKHSTGGVGDKTTIVIAPLVAACGGKVAKMSGRGLGFTGGTIDKLESIPGFTTAIEEKEFFRIVNEVGAAVIGQSAQIAPADKKLYALRDVTATVDSIPLIAASIMSKKLAAGSDKIVLDVTVGSGAFMKSMGEAITLSRKMIAIGEGAGKETIALITNMDVPLGNAIGNSLEIKEAIETLQGKGPQDFTEICYVFASYLLVKSGVCDTLEEARAKAEKAIQSGKALDQFAMMVNMQGGDAEYIYHPEHFASAEYTRKLLAQNDGFVTSLNTEACGVASVALGAGREKKDDLIDYAAGIRICKKTGDAVKAGDVLAVLYACDSKKLEAGEKILRSAYQISENPGTIHRHVLAYVSQKEVIRYE